MEGWLPPSQVRRRRRAASASTSVCHRVASAKHQHMVIYLPLQSSTLLVIIPFPCNQSSLAMA
jgi:hypothetical protein